MRKHRRQDRLLLRGEDDPSLGERPAKEGEARGLRLAVAEGATDQRAEALEGIHAYAEPSLADLQYGPDRHLALKGREDMLEASDAVIDAADADPPAGGRMAEHPLHVEDAHAVEERMEDAEVLRGGLLPLVRQRDGDPRAPAALAGPMKHAHGPRGVCADQTAVAPLVRR